MPGCSAWPDKSAPHLGHHLFPRLGHCWPSSPSEQPMALWEKQGFRNTDTALGACKGCPFPSSLFQYSMQEHEMEKRSWVQGGHKPIYSHQPPSPSGAGQLASKPADWKGWAQIRISAWPQCNSPKAEGLCVTTSWLTQALPPPGQLPVETLMGTEKWEAQPEDVNRSSMFCSVSLYIQPEPLLNSFLAAVQLGSQAE